MPRGMELTVTNRSQAYPEKAKKAERVSEAHECSAIEARRVKRMKENVLYVVLKVRILYFI